ncbi:MAG: 50S ribosomal protein L17 [Deltaproteobacteria bacterium]|nr:50S ribosomal protein L17 [Deltaproteobacteria bacterium]
MRHQKAGKKFTRTSSHRRALFRNLLSALVENGRIRTTHAKALVIRRLADKLVTLSKRTLIAKRAGAHARAVAFRRLARTRINDDVVLGKLIDVYAPRFEKRNGGYTRIVKLGNRRGDAAEMSLVELLPEDKPVAAAKGKGTSRKKSGPSSEKKGAAGKAADAAE